MPYFVMPDGTCTELDWTADKAEISARSAAGETYYGTLAGAVLHGGVKASAFDRAVKSEPLYNALEALRRPVGAPLPSPVGHCASYRVIVLEGQFHHPGLAPGDIGISA